MRFWDWFFRSLLGSAPSDAAPRATGRTNDGGRVAVLEPPPRENPQPGRDSGDCWWTPEPDARLAPEPNPQLALSTEALGLERILAACSDRDDLRLPTLPKVAERVLQLLAAQDYDARRIANEIAHDQVVSVALLRQANCVLYRGCEPVTDLHLAVTRLGATVLRTLMLQHSLRAVVHQRRGNERHLASIVWNGSLASATLMRGLGGLLAADVEEAYLVGLLHDIGNVLVLREAREQQSLLRYHLRPEEFVLLCRTHHERLGRLIAEAWDLPDKLTALISSHHDAVSADAPREIAMLALTDMCKALLGYAPPENYDLRASQPARSLGLSERPEFATFLDRLPDELAHIEPTF